MHGAAIPSGPLKPEQAKLLLQVLQSASVPALAVEPFLSAVLSLRRIAEGVDHVGTTD